MAGEKFCFKQEEFGGAMRQCQYSRQLTMQFRFVWLGFFLLFFSLNKNEKRWGGGWRSGWKEQPLEPWE